MTKPTPANKGVWQMLLFSVSEISLIICFCSPVKTGVVRNFTCLYSPAENVQNKGTILQARKKHVNESLEVICVIVNKEAQYL